jgi:hypothetical protein
MGATALPAAAGAASLHGRAVTPHGKLTSLEYSELSEMISGILASGHSGTVNWKAATAACEKADTSTPLLASQRSSCLAVMSTLSYVVGFAGAQQKCASGIAARGGAAKAATQNTSALQSIVCLDPEYRQLSRLAATMYALDTTARRQALARGFSGVCLATLVDTPPQLQVEQRLAVSAKSLAADADTISGVLLHKVASGKLNITRIDNDATSFSAAFTALTKLGGPVKLSVCPHQ